MVSPQPGAGGHLAYYQRHGISPVRYQYADLAAHFERRDGLYRSLGLPPAAFRGVRVLEVAAGSGQNSLYVASRQPAAYDLVEPNPAGQRDIRAAFAGLALDHTAPQLHTTRFEDFTANASYDIVLCENWLGSLPHEIALIRKLAGLVAPGGALVLTVVPLSGFFPNVVRKLLALRASDFTLPFDAQVAQLAAMFGPHLSTIANMTRSHEDWVKDCLLNPHYLNVALPLETVVEAIRGELEILATFPRFSMDWRWFKALAGEGRNFNTLALESCRQNVHNFIDYRAVFPARTAEANRDLDQAFTQFHRTALTWQAAFEAPDAAARSKLDAGINARLDALATMLRGIDAGLAEAVAEAASVWREPAIRADTIRNMKKFGGLFGRETVYVSFTRPI